MFQTIAGAGVHGLMPVAETNNDSIKHIPTAWHVFIAT